MFRPYDPDRDRTAAHRIWHEVGWLEKDKEPIADLFLSESQAWVAELQGEAECLVLATPGDLRYLDQSLDLVALTGVTTSRVARKQGLASRLAAQAVASGAAQGAHVAALGMFEQGYYNQLGFGTGGYEHWVGFDPARLAIQLKPRAPRRITTDDWAQVHAARLARVRGHGSCSLHPPSVTRGEMLWTDKGFGLGYMDGPDGALSHFVWCSERGEHGPYQVECMAFERDEQFLELMALLQSFGDQVRLVRMSEPPRVQLQDLIQQPFKQRQISEQGKFAAGVRASAHWQMRICDLGECISRAQLPCNEVRFNLALSDPIERLLDPSSPWRGVGGEYVVCLGPQSLVEPGKSSALPTLSLSVNAFTRMWLGVRPPTGLAMTDDLSGPRDLLQALDRALRLPEPKPDWEL